MTPDEQRILQELREKVAELESAVIELRAVASDVGHPLRPLFVADRGTSTAGAFTEKTNEGGSFVTYTGGRSYAGGTGVAKVIPLPDGHSVLLEERDTTGFRYTEVAGGQTAGPLTLGTAAAGSITADATTWSMTGDKKALDLYVLTRTVWDSSGDVLYGFLRKLSLNSGGHVFKVSGETRYTIDTPTSC